MPFFVQYAIALPLRSCRMWIFLMMVLEVREQHSFMFSYKGEMQRVHGIRWEVEPATHKKTKYLLKLPHNKKNVHRMFGNIVIRKLGRAFPVLSFKYYA